MIMQVQLVEAEMCCGLSLKGSYAFLRGALACIKELGGERPGLDYPILPGDLSCPSPPTLFPLLALPTIKFPQPKCSYSLLFILSVSDLFIWMIGHTKVGPGAT